MCVSFVVIKIILDSCVIITCHQGEWLSPTNKHVYFILPCSIIWLAYRVFIVPWFYFNYTRVNIMSTTLTVTIVFEYHLRPMFSRFYLRLNTHNFIYRLTVKTLRTWLYWTMPLKTTRGRIGRYYQIYFELLRYAMVYGIYYKHTNWIHTNQRQLRLFVVRVYCKMNLNEQLFFIR